MAKFRTKKRDCNLIINVRLTRKEKLNEAEFVFFSNKRIKGVYQAKKKKGKRIQYRGPIGISLYEKLKKPISENDFFTLLSATVEFTKEIKKNALAANKIIWDLHHVYINEKTKELRFIYLPLDIAKEGADEKIFGFLENIIYSIVPEEGEDSEYISKITQYIHNQTTYDPEKIEEYILKENKKLADIKKRENKKSGFITDKPKDYYEHYGDDTSLLDDDATGLLNELSYTSERFDQYDDEATGLLSDEEDTSLLSETKIDDCPKLYRVITAEIININRKVFRVGKERGCCDYYVDNNEAVSRNHADIIVRDHRYFVIDLNSKNRTYINDKIIPVRQEVELCDGDRLKLANEEFVFYSV